nr:MAG TPA: hypothetical protein [Caudoviricetes sp.]
MVYTPLPVVAKHATTESTLPQHIGEVTDMITNKKNNRK